MHLESESNIHTHIDDGNTASTHNENDPSEEQQQEKFCSEKQARTTTNDEQMRVANAKQSLNIHNLSPVEIVVANREDISDPIAQVESSFKRPSATNSRRSLFRKMWSPLHTGSNKPIISSTPNNLHQNVPFFQQVSASTPMNNQHKNAPFFRRTSDDSTLISPIRENAQVSDRLPPSKIIRTSASAVPLLPMPEIGLDIETPAETSAKLCSTVVHVQSLARIEKDLRSQYQIDKRMSPRKKSQNSQLPPTCTNARASNIERSVNLRESFVEIEKMDINSIVKYRQSQIRRLSVANLTDVNSIRMVETPVHGHNTAKHTVNSVLAEKLKRCERSPILCHSDLTEDESPKSSYAAPAKSQIVAGKTIELTSDNDDEPQLCFDLPSKLSPPNTRQSNRKRSKAEREELDEEDHHRENSVPRKIFRLLENVDENELQMLNKNQSSAENPINEQQDTQDISSSQDAEMQNESQTCLESPKSSKTYKEKSRSKPPTTAKKTNVPVNNESQSVNVAEKSIAQQSPIIHNCSPTVASNNSEESHAQPVEMITGDEPELNNDEPRQLRTRSQARNALKNIVEPQIKTPAVTKGKANNLNRHLNEKPENFKKPSVEDVTKPSTNSRTSNTETPLDYNTEIHLEHIHSRSDDSDGSIAAVPPEIISSFRHLKKNTSGNTSRKSFRVALPTKSKKRQIRVDPILESFIELTNRTTRQSFNGQCKKRTLLSLNDDAEHETETPSQSNALLMQQTSDEQSHIIEAQVFVKPVKCQTNAKEKSVERENEDSENRHEVSGAKSNLKEMPKKSTKDSQKLTASKNPSKRIQASEADDSEDEGFNSSGKDNVENDDPQNVIYDPYERGCARPGLRLRRYQRPWWIHNSNVNKIGIVYNVSSAKDMQEEVSLEKKMKKAHVTKSQLEAHRDCIGPLQYLPMKEKLKIFMKVKAVHESNHSKSSSGSTRKPLNSNVSRPKKNASRLPAALVNDSNQSSSSVTPSMTTVAPSMSSMTDSNAQAFCDLLQKISNGNNKESDNNSHGSSYQSVQSKALGSLHSISHLNFYF